MTDTSTRRLSRAALIGAILLVLTAAGVKLWRDRVPEITATSAGAAGPQDVGAMISALEDRLKANPNDAEGWQMLGWSLFQSQRYAEAAMAYKRATALKPDNGSYWSLLGESLVTAGNGTVPAAARDAFDKAVAIDPKDPRARYFIGVSKDLAGDHNGALDDWFALLKDTPTGAPWETDVVRTIDAVGKKNKIDVASRLVALRPAGVGVAPSSGPDAEQARAAAQLPAGQQQALIAGMVERLAAKLKADPSNVEGWIMLMRSYATLGRSNDAGVAYRSALAANPAAKAQLDEAAKTLGVAR